MKTTVRASVFINRPPESIAEVLHDPTKMVLWTKDLERFEVVSGVAAEPGAVARLHYRQGEQRYVMEDRLLEAEPGRRYLSRVSGPMLTAEVETMLEPVGGGTRVSIRWSGEGKVQPLRWLMPFMRRSIAREAQGDLEKLKRVVESG